MSYFQWKIPVMQYIFMQSRSPRLCYSQVAEACCTFRNVLFVETDRLATNAAHPCTLASVRVRSAHAMRQNQTNPCTTHLYSVFV